MVRAKRAAGRSTCHSSARGRRGGRPHEDGRTLVFYLDGDTPNTPAEAIEARYPILVDLSTYHLDSAGAGQYRGGLGIIRDYTVLADHVFLHTCNEGTTYPPRGLFGGQPGKPSYRLPGPVRPRSSSYTIGRRVGPLLPGDTVSARSDGGGGWGDPLQRDPNLVAQDVRNGLLSIEAAHAAYSVRLDPTSLAVDLEGTQSERVTRRA